MTKIKIDFSLKTRFQETSLCDLTYFHFQHVLRFHFKVIQKCNIYIFNFLNPCCHCARHLMFRSLKNNRMKSKSDCLNLVILFKNIL